MKDINFFSSYQSKFEVNNDIIKYLNKVLVVFGVFIILNLSVNSVRIFWYNSQINSYSEKLEDSVFKAKSVEANKVSKELEILNEYQSKILGLANSINEKNNVSYDLLIELSSVVPSEVNYTDLAIQSNQVVIQGISTSSDAIAELLHNLKELDIVGEAFTTSIDSNSSVEGQYSFEINCVLKEVL